MGSLANGKCGHFYRCPSCGYGPVTCVEDEHPDRDCICEWCGAEETARPDDPVFKGARFQNA